MPPRPSLAQILRASIELTPSDAVAVIVQLAHAPQTGRPRAIPLEPGHVWLEPGGDVTLAPGLVPKLAEFAALLDQLLAPAGEDVPRGLRCIVERAAGHGGVASLPTLTAFAAALAPFQPPDPAAAVRALVARLDQPQPIVGAASAGGALVVPAPVEASPDVAGPGWRPSRWHVGGAVAAAALAAMLGAAFARPWSAQAPAGPAVKEAPAAAMQATAPDSAPAGSDLAAPPIPAEKQREPETVAPQSGSEPPPAAATPETPDLPPAPGPMPEAPTPRSEPARLVDRRAVEADAVFSPSFAGSGTAVFFHAESPRGSALKRADADGGELRVATIVDDGARNYHVQLSPDGRQVAFDSDRDGVRGVYVADANGRGVQRVSGPGHAAVPSWSPDGGRLAFIRAEPDRPAVWNLWLLDRESGRQQRVTSFRRGQVWSGAWFADGQQIVYSHEDRLTIHDLATGRSRDIASPVAGRQVRTPAVSPDGRRIVFQVFRDGVWLYDVEDGTMRRVLDDASAEEFAWSPDGRRVAYHSRRSGGWNLWTMTAP
jgi:Tol biopolymer transport system component